MTISSKPTSAAEFQEWSTAATCGAFGLNVERWYKNTQGNLVTCWNESTFLGADAPLIAASASYRELKRAKLFSGEIRATELDWNRKTYASFIEKLFRLNVLENERFPAPPAQGWLTPRSALKFGAIDDLYRTTVTVAYADGPAFLAAYLKSRAEQMGYQCQVKDHSKEKGYYAHHVYIGIPVQIVDLENRNIDEQPVPIEIQITTELQAVLREITHRLYEQERLDGGPNSRWKEDFASSRFRAAYMAHSLRFIEAMVVDLRNKTLEETSK